MDCRTSFKISVSILSNDEVNEFIDEIGIDCGITDNFLYYGMIQRDTDDLDFHLFEQLDDTLSILYSKEQLLLELSNRFPVRYTVDVHFSNIEEEIEKNTSFNISVEAQRFIENTNSWYNLNNGYFD